MVRIIMTTFITYLLTVLVRVDDFLVQIRVELERPKSFWPDFTKLRPNTVNILYLKASSVCHLRGGSRMIIRFVHEIKISELNFIEQRLLVCFGNKFLQSLTMT
jgi:hypothetical protein